MTAVMPSVVMLAICAAVLWPLERRWPKHGKPQNIHAMGVCAGLFLVNAVVMVVVAAPLLSALHAAVGTCSTAVATPLRLTVIMVLADLAGYGIHRAMHTFPVLWRFHRLHHEAYDLTWWETWRQHPVDALLHALAVAIPGAVLGASASEGFGLVLLRVVYTSFIHADVRIHCGFAEGVIATPAFHHLHHSHDPRHRNGNYSTTLALIDRIFGTAMPSTTRAPRCDRAPGRRGMSAPWR